MVLQAMGCPGATRHHNPAPHAHPSRRVVSQVGFTSADVQRQELLGKRPLLVERTESSASSSDYKQH